MLLREGGNCVRGCSSVGIVVVPCACWGAVVDAPVGVCGYDAIGRGVGVSRGGPAGKMWARCLVFVVRSGVRRRAHCL